VLFETTNPKQQLQNGQQNGAVDLLAIGFADFFSFWQQAILLTSCFVQHELP